MVSRSRSRSRTRYRSRSPGLPLYLSPVSSPMRRPRSQSLTSRIMHGVAQGVQAVLANPAMQGTAVAAGTELVNRIAGRSQSRDARMRDPEPTRISYRTSRYRGKFKKPTRRGRSNKLTRMADKGLLHVAEICGQVEDPDCVYLSHMALDPTQVITMIIQVLLRKLFAKHGITIRSVNEEIAGADPTNSSGYQIRLMAQTVEPGASGYYSLQSVDTGDNASLATLSASFLDNFIKYSSGYSTTSTTGNANNSVELFSFQLYLLQSGVWVRAVSDVRFLEETVTIRGKSVMKIQNRTENGTGTNATDVVNNNPLQGRIYNFKGVPKAKVPGMFNLERPSIIGGGVVLARAAEFTSAAVASGMKEPPIPTIFYNCTSSSKVKLQPGALKTMSVSTKITKKLLPFLKQIRYQAGVNAVGFVTTYSIFKTQMIALEDMINVDVSEKILVAYELNRETAVQLKTKKATTALGDYSAASLNNFSPS